MKIVHITTVHNPFDNRIFFKECLHTVKMGHEVVLIAPHDQDQEFKGVKIKALAKPKSRLARMTIVNLQACKRALLEKADIYHFHDPEFIPMACLIYLRGRKRLVYDVHEDYYSSIMQKGYLPSFIRPLIASVFSKMELFLTKGFKKVLAEKYYGERFPDGLNVLNYPGQEILDVPVNKRSNDQLNLIYSGNISLERGAQEHVNILKYIENAKIYMVGYCEQELADYLYEQAGENRERLEIVGRGRYVPFAEIMAYYARGNWTAGLALIPDNPHYYYKELTKFFEYMGAGIPIICSNFPAWQELIKQTGAGICVDYANEMEIKRAVEYLYLNEQAAAAMGLKGRACVEHRFKWESELEKLEKLYDHLIQKK